MLSFAIATRETLFIVRSGRVEQHLAGQAPESIAVDPEDPTRLYVGTWGQGLWRSVDAGRVWESVGIGIPHRDISAVAVERVQESQPGMIFAGTEPSTLSRSDDGGETWRELRALLELPSVSSWSFPPKPETHHVRWIETDPNVTGKLYVAIEAGALVQSRDRGESWHDRVRGGPIDTHTAATHPEAIGRLFAAAGDGYFETDDGGDNWSRPMAGLRHGYMVGVAVDPGDPNTVVVSGASGPYAAYHPGNAEAYIHRKTAGKPFELAMVGLPEGRGTVAGRFATHSDEPGVFYVANNHGLFSSINAGRSWDSLEIPWPDSAFATGVAAMAAFPE